MREIRLRIDDETARDLETRISHLETSLEKFLESRIPGAIDDLLLRNQESWIPRGQWQDLVEGRECPICLDLGSDAAFGAGSFVVDRTRASVLTLSPNQSVPGYCVLWCSQHVTEPFQLEGETRCGYFRDLMCAAEAISSVHRADKINYQVLGNLVPHLHCHIVPRYYGDRAPGRPIHPDASPVFLRQEEYQERIEALRAAIRESRK